MKKAIILLLTVFCVTMVWGQSKEKRTIAVYLIASEKVDSEVKGIINNHIINVLTKTDKYEMVERNEEFVEQIDKERVTQLSGRVSETQIRKLGEEYGAGAVCITDVRILMGEISIDMRIVNVEKATIIRTGSAYGYYTGNSDIRKIVDNATSDMMGTLLEGSSGDTYAGTPGNSNNSGSSTTFPTTVDDSSFANNVNVQAAFNYMKKNMWGDALKEIQPALGNSQTSMQPKTWYYYTKICLAIELDETGIYKSLLANPLDEAAKACIKAMELDKKREYEDELSDMMRGITGLYSNKGVTDYESKKYAKAAENFVKAYEVTEQSGRPDMNMLRYAGNCWLEAKNWDKAEEIFTKLKQENYKDASGYIGLAKIAIAKKDLNKAVRYLNEGEQKYPKDLTLLIEKANMYMVGELSELDKHAALNTLVKITELEPNNASVWNSLGDCYALDLGKFEEASAAYKKCIRLDPKFISAYYGYSNLYLDKANRYIMEANNLPIEKQKEYDALIKQSEKIFMEVLPFVEQAYELDPNTGVKAILKEIYTRLKMTNKAAELK